VPRHSQDAGRIGSNSHISKAMLLRSHWFFAKIPSRAPFSTLFGRAP
jgi:hypothetical protein